VAAEIARGYVVLRPKDAVAIGVRREQDLHNKKLGGLADHCRGPARRCSGTPSEFFVSGYNPEKNIDVVR
jgi:hypothetical protein